METDVRSADTGTSVFAGEQKMKSLMERVFQVAGRLRRAVAPTLRERQAARWLADAGDRTLRLNYDLSAESVVFDLGGYIGQWASDIYSMHRCQLYVFEPVSAFAERISDRFRKNPCIRIFSFGLASSTREASIVPAGNGSSLFKTAGHAERVQLREARAFLVEQGIRGIDLMKVNIEGGEYELLEHLLDHGLMPTVTDLQIQFHDFVPNAFRRMRAIQARLILTHDVTFQYEFLWENWHRRA
jgi:FkbM family methyltransferase